MPSEPFMLTCNCGLRYPVWTPYAIELADCPTCGISFQDDTRTAFRAWSDVNSGSTSPTSPDFSSSPLVSHEASGVRAKLAPDSSLPALESSKKAEQEFAPDDDDDDDLESLVGQCPKCAAGFQTTWHELISDIYTCTACGWRFDVDIDTGEVEDCVPIETECPKCSKRFQEAEAGSVACRLCRTSFEIDGTGKCLEVYPVAKKVRYWTIRREIEAYPCSWCGQVLRPGDEVIDLDDSGPYCSDICAENAGEEAEERHARKKSPVKVPASNGCPPKQNPNPMLARRDEQGKSRVSAPAPNNHSGPSPNSTAVEPPDHQNRIMLQVLEKMTSTCTWCAVLATTRTQTVFGAGRLNPEVCFVGEAPGKVEDEQGRPFVGPAGVLLAKIIQAMGLSLDDVYLCNVLKCRPPGNRAPGAEEISNCSRYLEQELAIVNPQFIVALGTTAAQSLLKTQEPLERMRGSLHAYKNIPVVVTYHPAYLFPNCHPEKKKDVWEDMKMLLKAMGRSVPGR